MKTDTQENPTGAEAQPSVEAPKTSNLIVGNILEEKILPHIAESRRRREEADKRNDAEEARLNRLLGRG